MEAQKEYVTRLAELFPRQGEWTERHFFALPETNRIIELSDGVLLMTPSPTRRHQKVTATLYSLLDAFVTTHELGDAIIAPFDVRLRPGTIRQPDVLFIRQENLHRIRDDKYLDGPPDWVAEVISPATHETDEVTKLDEYARAGVPEYWLVDPEGRTIRVYTRADEAYTLAATAKAGQVARSVTIAGFEVAVDEVLGGV